MINSVQMFMWIITFLDIHIDIGDEGSEDKLQLFTFQF